MQGITLTTQHSMKKIVHQLEKGGYKVAKGHLKAIDIGAEAIYTLIVSQMWSHRQQLWVPELAPYDNTVIAGTWFVEPFWLAYIFPVFYTRESIIYILYSDAETNTHNK